MVIGGVDAVECGVRRAIQGGMISGGDDFQQHRSCERGFV